MHQEKFDFHDGERVRQILAKTTVTQAQLANVIGASPSKVSRMLNEPSWATRDLVLAGELLKYNFFQAYASQALIKPLLHGVLVDPNVLKDETTWRIARQQYLEQTHKTHSHKKSPR